MNIGAQEIIDYYDVMELDYRFGWNLGRNLAMHFGYWDDATATLVQALDRENAVLADLARVGPDDRVLDAGCGLGGSAIYLARCFDCHVTGITLSQKQADSAARHAQHCGLRNRIQFLKMDYLQTAFSAGAFDVVWAIESACHASDKGAFAREMHRVLTPTGRLVLADGFAARTHYDQRERFLMQQWLRGWCVDQLETAENFAAHLRQAGFQDVRFRDATPNILPSSRRLFVYSHPFLLLAALAWFLGRQMRIRARHVVAAHVQHQALRRGLWRYGIFTAQKGCG